MKQIEKTIYDFLQRHPAETVNLVLDSTGPSLTKHYLALSAIGTENLAKFKKIHTFSGGTFAYFGFLAAANNNCRHALPEYYKNLDRTMRRAHTELVPVLPPAIRFLRKKAFYNSAAPIESVIRYVFKDDFLASPASSLEKNFTAYYAPSKGQDQALIQFSSGKTISGIDTVFDVIRYAVNIPFLYGRNGQMSDPAFHPAYRRALKTVANSGEPALVVTPWKSGEKGSTLYLNPFAPANQKLVMGRDILCLLTNIPNPTYGRDLKAIFG
jgi:hypothetical protein